MSTLFILVVGEIAVRGYFAIKGKRHGADRTLDDRFGWSNWPNEQHERTLPGYDGVIRYSTSDHGFRVFGDPGSDLPKIMVLGDSYTQAPQVSDGETYYHHIQQHTRSQVFAYGSSGYGTYQEYLVFDTFFDLIDPDIVILQLCTNDFSNNLNTFEAVSGDNNFMVRPYLEGGETVYRYPSVSFEWINRMLRSSRLYRVAEGKLFSGRADRGETVEQELHPEHPLLVESVEVTKEILGLFRKRMSGRSIIAFDVGTLDYLGDAFRDVSQANDIIYDPGVGQAVKRAKASGERVDGTPHDAHWNATGHRIAGKRLVALLVERDLVEPRTSASEP